MTGILQQLKTERASTTFTLQMGKLRPRVGGRGEYHLLNTSDLPDMLKGLSQVTPFKDKKERMGHLAAKGPLCCTCKGQPPHSFLPDYEHECEPSA